MQAKPGELPAVAIGEIVEAECEEDERWIRVPVVEFNTVGLHRFFFVQAPYERRGPFFLDHINRNWRRIPTATPEKEGE